MSGVNTAAVVDNVPPGETLRSGWTKYNAHYHEYDSATLTNSSGGGLVTGDVVAVSTAGDSAVVLDDTLTSLRQFVVAQATIASTSSGEFARSGFCTAKIDSGGATRGRWLVKSETSKALKDSGVLITDGYVPEGAIGYAAQTIGASTTGTICLLPYTIGLGDRPRVLTKSPGGTDINNTSAETTIFSYTVPGGTLGTGRMIRLDAFFDYLNNTGVNRDVTVRVKYGGTTICTFSFTSVAFSATRYAAPMEVEMFAADSTSAQVAVGYQYLSLGISGGAGGTATRAMAGHKSIAIDSTVDQTLLITVQHSFASASASMRIFNSSILLMPSRT